MDAHEFENLAEQTLDALFEALDAAIGGDIDVDFDNGLLTLELDDGRAYILNKHAPNQELWLSSPLGGASHYAYDQDAQMWTSTRGEETLYAVLAKELSQIIGRDVALG